MRRIELKSEITASVANTGAEQINDVSRGAEAAVYIVTVIYFRSNEKARFKKRALSCGVYYAVNYYTIIVVDVYDARHQTFE